MSIVPFSALVATVYWEAFTNKGESRRRKKVVIMGFLGSRFRWSVSQLVGNENVLRSTRRTLLALFGSFLPF